ncbi:MAG: lipoyl synthase [Acidimicrobiales bacterium]
MTVTTTGPEPTPTAAAAGDVARPLRVRWLGSVDYGEAWDLQRALFAGNHDHLLLCTHPPVYTLGLRGRDEHLLVDPATVGAEALRVDRGGDITFHGPGQLVGYPIGTVPGKRGGGMADTVAYVTAVEQLVIDTVAELGVTASRIRGCPGVWVDAAGPRPRKLAAVGVKLTRGRSMHGFALNVDVDLGWFDHIVPCGLPDKGVTSLAAEGVDVDMAELVEIVSRRAGPVLAPGRPVERSDVTFRRTVEDLAPFTRAAGVTAAPRREPEAGVPVRLRTRRSEAGVEGGLPLGERKPSWMRVELTTGDEYRRMKRLSRSLDLVTVCEEAGCPNIFECWNEGTATFMLLGERCTRACGFCLVDTRHPEPVDVGEPNRIAEAVATLGLDHVVLTMVARDDLDDGGAEIVARSVEAIRDVAPDSRVEVLISDLQGSAKALARVVDARPDVLNHNIETVARLQRVVRPSAGYARSLTVLARAKAAGTITKSGLMVGLGERTDEVEATMADLAAVGVDIVTIGQYLRPTAAHLPIDRWWTPEEFAALADVGSRLGIGHVEASPLTRSSHHAGTAASVVLDRPAG